jgi:hypothetical protein
LREDVFCEDLNMGAAEVSEPANRWTLAIEDLLARLSKEMETAEDSGDRNAWFLQSEG